MTTIRLNVASVTKQLRPSDLERFAREAKEVLVYSTAHGERVIGRALSYEWTPPEDLWAVCEIDDAAAEFYAATRAHCEAICAFIPGQPPFLAAIVMTNYARGFLERALADMVERGREA